MSDTESTEQSTELEQPLHTGVPPLFDPLPGADRAEGRSGPRSRHGGITAASVGRR